MKYLTSGGLFFLGCVIGWAAALGWLHPPVDANTSASWVQAVGSIGAIFASALLLHYQANLQRRNRIRAICAVVEISVDAVTRNLAVPEDAIAAFDHFTGLDWSVVSFAYEALARIPLHEIDSVVIVRQTALATDAMRRIDAKLKSEEVVGASHLRQQAVIGRLFYEEVAILISVRSELARLV